MVDNIETKPAEKPVAKPATIPVYDLEIRWVDSGHGQRAHRVKAGSEYLKGYVAGLAEDGRNRDVRVCQPDTGEVVTL